MLEESTNELTALGALGHKSITYTEVDRETSHSSDNDNHQLTMLHIPEFQHSCKTYHHQLRNNWPLSKLH